MSSSRNMGLLGQLDLSASATLPVGLVAWLGQVRDPRGRRGRRHPLVAVLAAAACAVAVVGHDNVVAIAQWAEGAPQDVLARLGVWWDGWAQRWVAPSERTFGRVLAKVDGDELDRAVSGWLALKRGQDPARPAPARPASTSPPPAQPEPEQIEAEQIEAEQIEPEQIEAEQPIEGAPAGLVSVGAVREREARRRVRQQIALPVGLAPAVAAYGKRLAGSAAPGGAAVMLLAATGHRDRIVLGQRQVATKSNEIPQLKPLAAGLELAGAVLTVDALHTNRDTARWVVQDCEADYFLFLKGNQPTLLAEVMARLTGTDTQFAATTHTTLERGHGRDELRRVRTAPADGVDFPYAAQLARILRRTGPTSTAPAWASKDTPSFTTKEVAYVITSLTPQKAGPDHINAHARGHWSIENGHHYIRDVSFHEDASQVHTGTAPRAMAALRNLANGALSLASYANTAYGLRDMIHYGRALALFGI